MKRIYDAGTYSATFTTSNLHLFIQLEKSPECWEKVLAEIVKFQRIHNSAKAFHVEFFKKNPTTNLYTIIDSDEKLKFVNITHISIGVEQVNSEYARNNILIDLD